MAYIGNDVDAIFIPSSVNTSTDLRINGGALTQTGGDVNLDGGTFFLDESANRVGIGTITPGVTLDVVGTIRATNINALDLSVEDKNIVIGDVASPTNTTADGGGVTLKGAVDKTIAWLNATAAWTFSEHISIASAKEYRIAGTKVLDATSLGSAVVSSSLTSVGTIGTGVWQGTAIADTYLGTISTALKVSNSATTATNANTASAIVARDESGNFTAGTITAALTGAASSNVLKAGDTMTGALVVPLGVFGTPSLTFTDDLNTGIFSPGADQLAVATNGTSRLSIDASGSISINATGPKNPDGYNTTNFKFLTLQATTGATDRGAILELVGTGGGSPGYWLGRIGFFSTGNSYPHTSIFAVTDSGGSNGAALIFNTTTTANVSSPIERGRFRSDGTFEIKGAGTAGTSPGFSVNPSTPANSFVIDSSGRLGIGTSLPDVALHVVGGAILTGAVSVGTTASATSLQFPAVTGWGPRIQQGGASINDFGIFTNNTEHLTVKSSGSVGIGTTTPKGKLSILQPNTSTIGDGANSGISIVSVGGNAVGRINSIDFMAGYNIDTATVSIGYICTDDTLYGKGDIFFATRNTTSDVNATQRMRLDSSGRLLVGTPTARTIFENGTASARVQVEGTDNSTSRLTVIRNGGGGGITLAGTAGASVGSIDAVANNATVGEIAFAGSDGTDFVNAANISVYVDATATINAGSFVASRRYKIATVGTTDFTAIGASANTVGVIFTATGVGAGTGTATSEPYANSMPGRLVFSTTADGGSSPTERMRITSGGLVGIGTISPNSKLGVIDSSTGLAATIRNENATNGYGLAIETEGTSSTRYALILRNLASDVYYGGVSTATGQVGYWGIGVSPTGTLGNRLTVGGSASIGSGSYLTTAAPANGLIVQGNVGIGTSGPAYQLQVNAASDAVMSTSNSSSVTSGNRGTIAHLNSANSTCGMFRFAAVTDNVGTEIQFHTRPAAGSLTQSMTLDSAGRLGIGSSSPKAKLHIVLTASATTPIVNVGSFGAAGSVTLGGIANESEHVYLGTGDSSGGGIAAGIGFMRESAGWNSALSFYTNNVTLGPNGVSAIQEKMRITSGGLVGIGSTGPQGNLHIADATRANIIIKKTGLSTINNSTLATTYDTIQLGAGGSFLSYNVETATADTHIGHNFYRHSGEQFKYKYTDAAARLRFNSFQGEIIFDRAASGSANNNITFLESMRLDASGRLLIGTSFDRFSTKILVESTNGTSGITVARSSNDSGPPYKFFIKSRGDTVGSNTVVQSGDMLGFIGFYGTDGAAPISGASIYAAVDDDPGADDMPGRLVFSTNPGSPATGPTERMRINSSGQILAGALGTGALPIISFLDDPNTGIFSPGADQLAVATNGTPRLSIGASEVVFNDGGTDYDFRVESDTNTNIFFVDASANAIGMGMLPNIGDGILSVIAPAASNGAGTANVRLGMAIVEVTSGEGRGLWFGARTDENTGVIGTRTASGNLAFETYNGGWDERMRLTYQGKLLVGTTSNANGGQVEAKTATVVSGNPAYDKKAFIAQIPYATTNITSSLLAGFDSNIHGVDLGYRYNGTGYDLCFATNSTISGSPTERVSIDSTGVLQTTNGVQLNKSGSVVNNVKLVRTTGDGGGNTVQVYWNISFGADMAGGCLGGYQNGVYKSPGTTVTNSHQVAIYGFIST